MDLYKEEIFGLVLVCMFVDIFDEVIEFINNLFYGNGILLFILSGVVVCKF